MDTITDDRTTFADFVTKHQGGAMDDEVAATLRDVLAAVTLLGKAGSVTIKLAITPTGEGVTITHDVTSRAPKAAATGAFYFAGDDGMPTRRDPRQPSVPRTDGTPEPTFQED